MTPDTRTPEQRAADEQLFRADYAHFMGHSQFPAGRMDSPEEMNRPRINAPLILAVVGVIVMALIICIATERAWTESNRIRVEAGE